MGEHRESRLTIKRAVLEDYPRILSFYWNLIDVLPSLPYTPKWTKDVYPTKDEILAYIERGDLYYGETEGNVVAAMGINAVPNLGYETAPWPSGCLMEEANFLHLLGVSPEYMHQGLGREMVEKALAFAKEKGAKVMRLDVVEGNLPAERLYLSLGFQFVQRSLLYYEDTGWCYFRLYEKIL